MTREARACVGVVETVLEPGEGGPESIWKLEEDLVHDKDGFLPEVRLTGTHQGQHIISQVPMEIGRLETNI